MFVIVVLFMPKGLVGIPGQLHDLWQRWKRSREPDSPAPTAPTPLAEESK
jgi:urea transport system permease protein